MMKRILLIDDEVDFTGLAKFALERGGEFEVCTVNNAPMAVSTARRFQPDVVVCDIVMPKMDGGQIIEEFKRDEALRHIPIIVMSALLNETAVAYKSLDQNEVEEILEKPVQLNHLRERIRAVLAR